MNFPQFGAINPPRGIPTGGLDTTAKIIANLLEAGLAVVFFLCFLALIIAGIKWITSSGDKDALKKAREMIVYALTGLIIAMVSFALVSFIGTFYGLKGFFGINPSEVTKTDTKSACPPGQNSWRLLTGEYVCYPAGQNPPTEY